MAVSTQKQAKRQPANFMEALQTLGREVVADAREQFGLDQQPPTPMGGALNPNESFSLSDIVSAEKRGEQKVRQIAEEERARAQHREEEAKTQIKSLQEEIKMLARSLGEFGKEAQIAALQAPVSPGIYHRNFFEQLRSFIKALRQRVQDSRHWLATQNARASKRKGLYWNNVQKSGTKYMLSGERYMVTTTG